MKMILLLTQMLIHFATLEINVYVRYKLYNTKLGFLLSIYGVILTEFDDIVRGRGQYIKIQ